MDFTRSELEGMIAHLEQLLADTDKEFILSLIDLFRLQGEKIHDELMLAATIGDIKTLERSAHSLKGAAANLGAAGLRGFCQTVENAAHRGEVNLDQVRQLGDLLHSTSDALEGVKTWLGSEKENVT
jgi:HPt (histidine-containing phosphotransfer) domain-containing protein